MNKIGYARVSSLDQNIDRQIQVLEEQTTKIFTDKESGTSRKRQGLKELLDFKREDKKLIHAFDLYLGGKTDKEVEEMTGINRVTFRRYRLKYNIKR